jgi:peptidoglycan/LPS O-acetylase OafA/YrhL
MASLIVCFHHTTYDWLPFLRTGWGADPASSNNHIFQLPILRIIYSGGAMVAIFFVISGYVLSTKALRLSRQARYPELFDSLYSSTFRRGLRLYIPCTVLTFVNANLAMMNLLNGAPYPKYPDYGTQMWVWVQESLRCISPIAEGTAFDGSLWTIPREFKGSLMIFLTALGLAKCRPVLRTSLLGVFAGYWFYWAYYDLFLFAAGMLLADLHYYFEPIVAINLPSTEAEHDQLAAVCPRRTWKYLSSFAHTVFIVFTVYLLSLPDYDEGAASSTLGVSFFSITLTPPSWRSHWGASRFWACISSVMLVAVIDHAGAKSWMQRIFRTQGARYLGNISFSIYLVHGVMVHSFGKWLEGMMFRVVGNDGALQHGLAITGIYLIWSPVVFWLSDVFTVLVDRPSVRLARRLMP